MKHFRIFLFWALITGSTSVALGQQSKPGSDREKGSDRREKVQETKKSDPNDRAEADEDEDDSDYEMAASRNGGNGRAPDPRNRSKNMVASDVYEALAVSASEEFAEDFGITDAKDRDELLRACRKYYRAKELLDAQFADKESGPYLKKSEVLEREYSKELRRVLPES